MNAVIFGAILLAQVAPLPELEDAAADAALRSPRTVHYDSRTIPAAYQHAGGFHSPSYNISADPTDSPLRHGEGGNANVQFPWQFGGGLDHAPDVRTSKAITLPENGRGGVWPIIAWRGQLVGHPGIGPEAGWRWRFPRGAIVWEILSHPVGGRLTVFEVRRRTRLETEWDTAVYRPFPRCEELAKELERRDADRYRLTVAALRAPEALESRDMTDWANRTRPAFVGRAGVAWMPVLPEPLVAELLAKPFLDATGHEWKRGTNGAICYAPTTDAPGQLVPRGYAGSLVGTDTDSCAKCHDGTAKHARHFDAARGWYGHVRGDDRIFSFHPIRAADVSYNGATRPAALDPDLIRAGVVAEYDPRRHPAEIYRRLEE